jgi:hypothetical protein
MSLDNAFFEMLPAQTTVAGLIPALPALQRIDEANAWPIQALFAADLDRPTCLRFCSPSVKTSAALGSATQIRPGLNV